MTREIICGKCLLGALIEQETPAGRTILVALCRGYAGDNDLAFVIPAVECPKYKPMVEETE